MNVSISLVPLDVTDHHGWENSDFVPISKGATTPR
jgi:hypothetical protein